MTLNCSVSSSAPATTNVVMGYVGINMYYIDMDQTSLENVKIVNDFISVIGKHALVDILDYNIDDNFEANIVIPGEADIEEITIDYTSLTAAKKNKVNAFVELVLSTITPTNN
jgi:hypothetical protein